MIERLHRAVLGAVNRVSRPGHPIRRAAGPLYSALLDAATLGRGLPATINGAVFRIDPRFRWTAWHAHEAAVADFLRARVSPGQCCFDVGANVGIYVLQLARWSAPDGRVVAFEPNPATLRVLRRHVRLNHLDSRVTVVPMGAGAAAGDALLYDTEAGSGLSRIGAVHPGTRVPVTPQTIAMTTVDEYCRTSGLVPDWMLIDVEGYEYEVLRGAADTLRRHRPQVVVELHQQVSSEGSREAGLRLLDELGLDAIPIPGATGRAEQFVSLQRRS